jgi:RHH-type proline utilization regulon transcriptional repressor/proline dehydrogenase/delta 1-pyrroline-5-carboxylate dehydrogenase
MSKFPTQTALIEDLIRQADMSAELRAQISTRAATLVRRIRSEAEPSMMEHFLSEYGLSTREGVALMCLAEAMLRVPDKGTIDALIEDKIAPSDWGRHLGEASSPLVNASTWALMLTGRVLEQPERGIAGTLRGAIKRLGEPVIRAAVGQAMKEMGRQFVLGQTIEGALTRARKTEAQGYTYSYDMLGEAAMTQADADRYAKAYADAIIAIAGACDKGSTAANPGISIKLSALHPRYELAQEARVMAELVPVVRNLARQAAKAGMGLNIDAEEQARLTVSMRVIEAVLEDPQLAGWAGFGVVVQAYGKRAGAVIDWLNDTALRLDRKIMVRLVKGAYWDAEMKLAQVEGHPDFPLFTSKVATDISYLANAKKLLGYAGRIYPQFATHNAHTVAAILELAADMGITGRDAFEFQRLHGMGERLHDIVLRDSKTRCRIYAPVGAHRDLLAYLVRRLLENGANSSFVNQIVDEDVTPEEIAADPMTMTREAPTGLLPPAMIFGADRVNSKGFDITDEDTLAEIYAAREVALPEAGPIVATAGAVGAAVAVTNPATGAQIASAQQADLDCVARAIDAAAPWDAPVAERAAVLRRAADLMEADFGLIFATLAREAGKTLADAVGELREAVDFLRYYASEAETADPTPRGIMTAISPWNFPLAIFSGQISAALAAGNAVLAKPAEQTPIIAAIAVRHFLAAGVPARALQLLPGSGAVVGAALTSDPRVSGVVFTGSTATAMRIRNTMVENLPAGAPLIAETGGLNAMIVDSTALPEQAVRDIVAASFRSAGQRCSALRCLYLQEDVAPHVIEMIKGAMNELRVGDPWDLATDVGPVIDEQARSQIAQYVDAARAQGRVIHEGKLPQGEALQAGHYIAPVMLRVGGIAEMEREVFGPVLHVATFKTGKVAEVIEAINATGYGLTFGLHTRIDTRVQKVFDAVNCGNMYVNRNQIGAVVGSQPFGGEGLSGTGPKAGGPHYLARMCARPAPQLAADKPFAKEASPVDLAARIKSAQPAAIIVSETLLPGPTGELNRLTARPRPPVLCLGPSEAAMRVQIALVESLGGCAVGAQGRVDPSLLTTLRGISAAIWWGDAEQGRAFGKALAAREGAIVPLITGAPDAAHVLLERHICVDTTAAGGNAALLAGEVEPATPVDEVDAGPAL